MSAIERFEPESPLIGGDPEDAARMQAFIDFQETLGKNDRDTFDQEEVTARLLDATNKADLPEPISIEEWHKDANCKGQANLYFPQIELDDKFKPVRRETYQEKRIRLRRAAEVCASCIVQNLCDRRVS